MRLGMQKLAREISRGNFNLREGQQCENEEVRHQNSAQTEKELTVQLGVAQRVVRLLYSYK